MCNFEDIKIDFIMEFAGERIRALRWKLCSLLLFYAFQIAPKGEARDRLIEALDLAADRFSADVDDKIGPSSKQ